MGAAKHIVRVCRGLSCRERGADELYEAAKQRADGSPGVVVHACACQNQCELGPNVFVDRAIHHNVVAARVGELLDDLVRERSSA